MPGRDDIFQQAMKDGHSAAWDQDWEQAALSYHKALAEFPENPRALNNYALALYQMQRYADALEIYKRVVKITPSDPFPMEKIVLLSERMGNLKEAVDAALKAAELYLQIRDADKAIENWVRVTSLNPEHVVAHSRLAMVHEKMGQNKQAVTEFIAVASLMQRSGDPQKAIELVTHAIKLDPTSAEARQAQGLLRAGQLLPKPARPKGGTGPLRIAQVKAAEPVTVAKQVFDPITEARKKALATLADILFDISDGSAEAQQRRGMQALLKASTPVSTAPNDQTRIKLHLSTAIDAQTKGNDAQASIELEHALEAGLKHSALFFDLGYLRAKGDRLESALRNLQQCVKHQDYGLGARLLSADILRKMGRLKEASLEYLEALKTADATIVPANQADTIRQLYEPLVESLAGEEDEAKLTQLCDNIKGMLVRENWSAQLVKAREQLPKSASGQALPLAEILIQAQSAQVLESMSAVNQLAKAGKLRSAMDIAYQALAHAPTYLPLHSLIGELLILENHPQDAIAKFLVIAHAYSARGEAFQATNMYRRILQLAPMDLAVRTSLIDQLIARGQNNEAITEYFELADIYYRLAELDMSRKTYTTALKIAQQPGAERDWSQRILRRMADIDMQRLDWKSAMRVYEQIRTAEPEDEHTRRSLIDLHLRLGQKPQAQAELDGYLSYLEGKQQSELAIKFCQDLITENPEQLDFRRSLAGVLQRFGRVAEAIVQLDILCNTLMEAGDTVGLTKIVSAILSLNPPNAGQYQELLKKLQGR